MKCFACLNEISDKNFRHVYFCCKNLGISLSKNDIRYKQICFMLEFEFTKEMIEDNYIVQRKSLPDMRRDYGLAYKQTEFLIQYFGLKIRSIKESCDDKRKNKYKNTCIDRYGVDNVSKVNYVKEKKKKTTTINYGVDNIWKKRDFILQRMKNKYGCGSVPNINGNANYWGWKTTTEEDKGTRLKKLWDGGKKFCDNLTDEEKYALTQRRCSGIVNYSSGLETRIQRVLSAMGISHTWQKWIKNRSYDFNISETKIILEIQGDYWHCNPVKYKPDDLVKFPGGISILAKDVWEKDKIKMELANKYGYVVFYIWEHDMNKMNDEQLSNHILLLMEKCYENKINN